MPHPPKLVCLNIFENLVPAINNGELIESVSNKDKEFHFQNWFEKRLAHAQLNFDQGGRNTYPDYSLVHSPEGFELKALAWPGRERDYDCNSQVPSGQHNGRHIFYIFGRYPADLKPYGAAEGIKQYPVIDLVMCHGDFLNSDHNYVHKNKNVKGFGSYGDIMIRDRKMYVAPTPFALTVGTTGLRTLILPADWPVDDRFQLVGNLRRTEAESLVIGYSFDLRTNEIIAQKIPNPRAGTHHEFRAYRASTEAPVPVTMVGGVVQPLDIPDQEGEQ
jgi:hypothetical protein